MAYKALYRKYRPSTFDEVVGQQYIVATLKNAIKTNKLAHAYLFCGPRGTGKTSVAKLLAKTINCESDGDKPCGKCASCVDIQESAHPDVYELDAATNNGVEEVRDIIDKVKYAPMRGKYKVYIIDEVHMMTTSAFNALLKTLEEPPEYCIFILATTEPQKVLPTIISRCQRFDFRKIAKDVIKENLTRIAKIENIDCTEEAIDLIAELADGGMRDALSIMDQCIAYAQEHITLEAVSAVYGVATLRDKLELFDCIKKTEAKVLVDKINEIAFKGIDVQRLTNDLINIAKECVVYSYSKDANILTVLDKKQAQKLLDEFSVSQLLTYIDYLIDTQGKYFNASSALTYFEVCMLKMMNYGKEEYVEQPVQVAKKSSTKTKAVESKPVFESTTVSQEKKPTKVESVTDDFNPKVSVEYVKHDDEKIYSVLRNANKDLKEKDKKALSNVSMNNVGDIEMAVRTVMNADIFASSSDFIIVTVTDRNVANTINETKANEQIKKYLGQFLSKEKEIYAVTAEERTYLITLFKSRQSAPVATKEPEKVEEKSSVESKAEMLFGKDGFDVVGE